MKAPFHTCKNHLPAPLSYSTSQAGVWHGWQQWKPGELGHKTSQFYILKLLYGRNSLQSNNISLKPLSFRTSLNVKNHGEAGLHTLNWKMLVPVFSIRFKAHFHIALLRWNSKTENVRCIYNIMLLIYTENPYQTIPRVSYYCTEFIERETISTPNKWLFSLHLNYFCNTETFFCMCYLHFGAWNEHKKCLQLRKGPCKHNMRCARKFCLPHFPLLAQDRFTCMLMWGAGFICESICTYTWW